MTHTLSLLIAAILLAVATLYIVKLRTQLTSYRNRVSDLKQQIQQLEQRQQSSASLDAIVAQVNEAVLRLGHHGKVLAANPVAQKVLNINGADLPQPMRRFLRDDEWNEALNSALCALPELSRLPEIKIAGKVLEPRMAQLESGEALLLCLDVTARHRLEQQRRTFLSNLMHDLKTPLTSLLGYARSMESFGDQADFRKEASTVIAEEAKHVNHLLDVLLTLDHAEFAERDPNLHCDATEVLERSCKMLKEQCAAEQITIAVESGPTAVPVAISFDDLDRICTNLLVNALNYSPQGGVIRVTTDTGDDRYSITIADEGPGIPAKHLPRVTERFYRVDKARSRKRKSHGLGLAIVRELLELNHGSLRLTNIEPHGLKAEFTIPLHNT